MTDIKPRPNHAQYLETMRRMTPDQKAKIVFELTDMANAACKAGIRHRHPEWTEAQVHEEFLAIIARCHNQNY